MKYASFPYRMLYSAPDVEYPGYHGGSTHVGEAVTSLSKMCDRIYLLCKLTAGQAFFEKQEKITIFRVWIPEVPVVRTIAYFAYSFFLSFFLCLIGRINVVYERARLFGGGGVMGSSLFFVPSVYEMIEPYVDIPVVLGQISEGSAVHGLLKSWHSLLVEKAEMVTVTHTSFLRSVPREKAVFVHTGVDVKKFRPGKGWKELVKEYSLTKGKTLLYVGSFTEWHSCLTIIRAVAAVIKKDKKVHLLMVGEGKQQLACMRLVKDLKLEKNVHFVGKVDFEDVPLVVNTADVCLALFDRMYPPFRKLDYYYSTIKIHEYKACGKPVIASSMGVLKQLVKKNQGLLVNEQKVGEVAKAMLILMKNKKLREKMGKNAREDVVKHYTWDFMNRKILEELTRRL